MTTKSKARVSKNQKLRDAVADASSNLKEAGEALHGRGPSAQYAAAFQLYSEALKELVKFVMPVFPADWSWNGYEGRFDFRWDLSTQLVKPGCSEFETRYVHMNTSATFDDSAPLDDELERLAREATYLVELRGAMMRWATERAKS